LRHSLEVWRSGLVELVGLKALEEPADLGE